MSGRDTGSSLAGVTTSDTADLQSRLQRTVEAVGASGLDGLLVSPGPDLRYLTGYDAIPLERLTCLVVPASRTGTHRRARTRGRRRDGQSDRRSGR